NDQLNFSDSAETTAHTYTLTTTTLQRDGTALMTYDITNNFSLTTGSGNDTLNANDFSFGPSNTTLNLGAGDDKILWNSQFSTTPNVTVEAGPGTDLFQWNAAAA